MQHLEQFHREAVNKNLSAGAILLWQQLYFTMERKNQFADLPLNTAVLTAQLKVSRQGLALMRQALADNGLLAVRVDEHQQTFYTLMLNGKVMGDGATVTGTNDFCAMPVGEGSPFPRIMDMAQSITGTESAQKTRQTAPATHDVWVSVGDGHWTSRCIAINECDTNGASPDGLSRAPAPTVNMRKSFAAGAVWRVFCADSVPVMDCAISMICGKGLPPPTVFPSIINV